MGSRHYYLRSRFEAEKNTESGTVPFHAPGKVEPRAYMLGASMAVASTLEANIEVIAGILKPIGFTARPNTFQTALQRQGWVAAERSDRLGTPWSDGFLDDTSDMQMDRTEVGFYIAELFKQNGDYFEQFDSGAGNCFYVHDYITGRAWRFM